MIKIKHLIIALLIIFCCFVRGFSYNVITDKVSIYNSDTGATEKLKAFGGHETITKNTINNLKFGDDKLTNELEGNKENIMKGTTDADIKPLPLTHFYDPRTGKGLLGIFPNAKDTAKIYYDAAVFAYQKYNKRIAYRYLGQALHLLQDMGSPSHVNNAPHDYHFYKGIGYEWWVQNNWNIIDPYLINLFSYPQFKYLIEAGDMGGYIEAMAKQTKFGGFSYDMDHAQSPEGEYIPRLTVSSAEAEYNAKMLLPMVIRLSGGLFKTFWKEVGEGNPAPPANGGGGDHGDDTFDVSSRRVELEGLDTTGELWKDLYTRVGAKKGYTGFKQC